MLLLDFQLSEHQQFHLLVFLKIADQWIQENFQVQYCKFLQFFFLLKSIHSHNCTFAESSQDPSRLVDVSSIYSQSESINNSTHDVEFIDPAIMAVGRGKLQPVTRSTMPFIGSSSLHTSISQATPLSQQARLIDYDSSCQPNHEGTYINYGSMNSTSQTGYLNQDHDSLLPSLFHSSLNESINHQRLSGQYHNATFQRSIQDSVYGNGTTKTRFQPTFWEDWNIIPEVNSTGQQSVNMVGKSAVPHMSLDRVPQSLLEELSRNKVVMKLLM